MTPGENNLERQQWPLGSRADSQSPTEYSARETQGRKKPIQALRDQRAMSSTKLSMGKSGKGNDPSTAAFKELLWTTRHTDSEYQTNT